jgi:prevent-host-death family protein
MVNIHEAKTHFSKLVERAEKGEDIVIARAGKPVARLVAFHERPGARKPGALKGKIWIADDFDETPECLIDALEIAPDDAYHA